jgi:hypothetical protein
MRRTCALLNPHSGRGQTTVLGWNDPDFGALLRPKNLRGRSSPMDSSSSFARAYLRINNRPRSRKTVTE